MKAFIGYTFANQAAEILSKISLFGTKFFFMRNLTPEELMM